MKAINHLLKKIFYTGLILGAVFLSENGWSQNTVINIPITGTSQPSNFDKRFANLIKRWQIPGASVAVMRNGQLILAHGYGWADKEQRQPVQPNSIFRIGSVSKAITAVAILKLVEEGRLKLDDKVFRILSDIAPLNARNNPQVYQITVRNLLQMSSGWTTDYIDPMFGPWSVHMMNQLAALPNDEVPPNCEIAARLMKGIPLQFKPGTQFSYSNLNYCMLGLITNKVIGNSYDYQSYENYVQQNILAPAGITQMRIGDTLPQNRMPGEVKYYAITELTPNPNDMESNLVKVDGLPYGNAQILKRNFSDGGWIASATDLTRFLQALNNGQIISRRMVQIMLQRPHFQRKNASYFAMAWTVKRIGNHLYWYKTGSFTGTYALIMQRDDGTSYAALFNMKPPQRIQFLTQLRQVLISA